MRGRNALAAALLLQPGCSSTTATPSNAIEAPGVPRSLRQGHLLRAGGELVLIEDQGIRTGDAVVPTPERVAVAVDPQGTVQVVSRGSPFIEVRRLGEKDPWLTWIAPARAPSQLLWGEEAAWLLHRGTRRATAHPVKPTDTKRLVSVELSDRYLDAAIAPDGTLWIASANGMLRHVGLDGADTDLSIGLGAIERIAFQGEQLWVLAFDGRIARIDPKTGTTDVRTRLSHAGLAFTPRADGSVVAVTATEAVGQLQVHLVDPEGTVTWSSDPFEDHGRDLVVDGDQVWIGAPGHVQRLSIGDT